MWMAMDGRGEMEQRGRSAPGGASLAAVPVLVSSFYALIHVHLFILHLEDTLHWSTSINEKG